MAAAGDIVKVCCPDCGIGFMEFRNAGRLGCAQDYEVFRQQLTPLVERLHRATHHRGKRPLRLRGDVEAFGDLRRLRRDLASAAAAGDYERAATLRDLVRAKDREHGP
jgi:protein arginine kinase activator